MNPYEALIQSSPVEGEQAKLMAARLRNQDDRATLALLSGDKPLGRVAELEAGNTARTVKGLQKAKEQALMRSEQQADRAGQNTRHAETQDRMAEQFKLQQEANQLNRQEMRADRALTRQMRQDQINATAGQTALRNSERLEAVQAKADKEVKNDVRKYSDKLDDSGITEMEGIFANTDKIMSKHFNVSTGERVKGKDDIPGVNRVASITPDWISNMTEGAEEVQQAIATLENPILKARSGAAVTHPEAVRLKKELGLSLGQSEESFIRAYTQLKNFYAGYKDALSRGVTDEALQQYRYNTDREGQGTFQKYTGTEQAVRNSGEPQVFQTQGGLDFTVNQ